MSAETWGIVLRDRASSAEQRIACEVRPIGDGAWRANPKGMVSSSEGNSASGAVKALALFIERADPTLAFVRIETPAEYAAHMEAVRRTLAFDEVERLRAEVTRLADTLGAIGRGVGAESCDRDVILAAIRERADDAFRRGAEAAMIESAGVARRDGAWGIAEAIRALSLPVEATSPPAQSHGAPATPDAPLTVADAAARARSAAAQREASPITPSGREVRYGDLRAGDRVRTCGEVAEVLRVYAESPDEVTVALRVNGRVVVRERLNAAQFIEVVR